ncbi:MAG: hypothetical protein HYS18_02605 [Burkholderiales bacterium]|nr:hypothetical protein [Burkholderiales bacterium]
MDEIDYQSDEPFQERPWIKWESTFEIDAWIDSYNRDLRNLVKDPRAKGYGICFILEAGGEIYLHTMPEGVVLIDVPPEAEWISPILTTIIQTEAPKSQIWTMPIDKLTQLIFGLNSLIKATRMVLHHEFRIKR